MKCPSCGSEAGEPLKTWKYSRGVFDVSSYACPKCGLRFNIYEAKGEPRFILALREGRFRKFEPKVPWP